MYYIIYIILRKSKWVRQKNLRLLLPHDIRRATYLFMALVLITFSEEIIKILTQMRMELQTATYKLVLLTAATLVGPGVCFFWSCSNFSSQVQCNALLKGTDLDIDFLLPFKPFLKPIICPIPEFCTGM
jgi:hypothetical protein